MHVIRYAITSAIDTWCVARADKQQSMMPRGSIMQAHHNLPCLVANLAGRSRRRMKGIAVMILVKIFGVKFVDLQEWKYTQSSYASAIAHTVNLHSHSSNLDQPIFLFLFWILVCRFRQILYVNANVSIIVQSINCGRDYRWFPALVDASLLPILRGK